MQQKQQSEQESVDQLKNQIDLMKQQHSEELWNVRFESMLEFEIYKAKGRSKKAICAMLDLENLKQSEHPQQEIAQALGQLKAESEYLFDGDGIAMYAVGTAVDCPTETTHSALRAAFGLPL